jgi:AraC family transcriptional regulator
MDSIRRLNQAMDYIEDHLIDRIDYEAIDRITCCPSGLFSRMFSVLAGMPISEYIRKRRLSLAALDLKDGRSVIEVSMKYGYESPDAFSQAFKKMHRVTPRDVIKDQSMLIHVPKMSFSMTMEGVRSMKYQLIQREAFTVLGRSIKTSSEDNMKHGTISTFWQEAPTQGLESKLCKLNDDRPFLGVCYGMENDGHFRYMIGVETKKTDATLEQLVIPASTWAVFESIGPMPDAIQRVWRSIYEDFFPSSGYRHAGTPDFESYPESGSDRQDYRCEVWIPVVKSHE